MPSPPQATAASNALAFYLTSGADVLPPLDLRVRVLHAAPRHRLALQDKDLDCFSAMQAWFEQKFGAEVKSELGQLGHQCSLFPITPAPEVRRRFVDGFACQRWLPWDRASKQQPRNAVVHTLSYRRRQTALAPTQLSSTVTVRSLMVLLPNLLLNLNLERGAHGCLARALSLLQTDLCTTDQLSASRALRPPAQRFHADKA